MDKYCIALTKDFLDFPWFHRPKTVHVFLYLLLMANVKTTYCGKDKIGRGSLVIKNWIIAQECGMTIQNVRTALHNLESTGEITRERRNKYQIITITDYDNYGFYDSLHDD